MAPPPLHHEQHHGLLHHHTEHHEHAEDEDPTEEPPRPCSQCKAPIAAEAKYCMMCGSEKPKPRLCSGLGSRRLTAVEEDCVDESGVRRTVWLFLHGAGEADGPWILKYSSRYEMFSVALVLYLVVADILVSIPEVALMFAKSSMIACAEAFVYFVFTTEYITRLWSCMESRELAKLGSCRGRIKLMRGGIEMVDLIVLLAYYINFLPGFSKFKGLSALRMIRLLRVAALLKVERKTSSFSKIISVLKTKRSELMATLFTAAVLMVMSATTMYYLENPSQPEAFRSVPSAMWWSVTALTTVGYGDVVPVTAGGKVLGAIVAFFGVGLFALPAGILGSGFVEEVAKAKEAEAAATAAAIEIEEEDELLEEEEQEAALITGLMDETATLRKTVSGLQSGQCEILNLLQAISPSFRTQTPSLSPSKINNETLNSSGPDKELAALQDSVIVKLNWLRHAKSVPLKEHMDQKSW